MASIAAACRASARAATQQLRNRHGSRRAFHAAQASLAAQNFNMPALSPTMTEGNIATWKIKEGDSFSAGDVLLEIETDKAQMDVEAQDDGVLAKILIGDGSKAVQVGTRIAVTAESGDDVSSLQIPEEDSPAPKEAEAAKEPSKKDSKPEPEAAPNKERTMTSTSGSDASKKASSAKATTQKYPLYPSVEHLLKTNGLTKEDADKIPATGPNGRLLKGDVLAYVGKIKDSYPSELADRFKVLSHLDLSNIKVAAKKEPPRTIAATEAPLPVQDLHVELALPVSLTAVVECQKRVKDSIGVFLPLSTFVARAAELANEDLPRSKNAKPSSDELFNAVLGLDQVRSRYSRGSFTPQVTAISTTASSSTRASSLKKPDLLDILAGNPVARHSRSKSGSRATATVDSLNVFSISVPKGDEQRGQVFLERVKTVLEAEPGRLVV
ncbi:pyridoxine biosynthesis protein [Coniothyrium glycines]